MMNARLVVAVILLSAAGHLGCRRQAVPASPDYLDATAALAYPLGWLGGAAHPATRSVRVPGPEQPVTGGLVVTETTAGGLLAGAAVQRGDVIVGVGQQWLPNKENPHADFIRLLEAEVSAGVDPLQLTLLHAGELRTVAMAHGRQPLEVGLPIASQRWAAMAAAARERLAAMITADGAPDVAIVRHALVGLALLAGGADRETHSVLQRCHQQVIEGLDLHGQDLAAWPLAVATMFLAEWQGPLVAGSAAEVAFSLDGLPPGMMVTGEPPPGMPAGGGIITSFSFESTSGEELPEGLDLEELMQGDGGGMFIMGGMMPPGAAAPSGGGESTPLGDGPLWTLADLQAFADAGTLAELATLQQAVDRLVALQAPSGGWESPDAADRNPSEVTLITNDVLLALGTAQSAGVPVPGRTLVAALGRLRAATNDGHVHSLQVPGFDRRAEAARSSGAAAALMALHCVDSDPFLRELLDYSDKHARDVPQRAVGLPLHIWHTAIAARQRGREAWATFFEQFRDVIVSVQHAEGEFLAWPREAELDGFGPYLSDETVRAALWTLVLSLQAEHVPVLAGTARHPLQPTLTSTGEQMASGMGTAPAVPAGAQMMSEEDARKMLERLGVDLDQVMEDALRGAPDDDE